MFFEEGILSHSSASLAIKCEFIKLETPLLLLASTLFFASLASFFG
jgi:hypothetical protein